MHSTQRIPYNLYYLNKEKRRGDQKQADKSDMLPVVTRTISVSLTVPIISSVPVSVARPKGSSAIPCKEIKFTIGAAVTLWSYI